MSDNARPSSLPIMDRQGEGYVLYPTAHSLPAGYIQTGPNMDGWGWTVGLGWHTGLPTLGAALDAVLADPAYGVDVHGTATKGSTDAACEWCGRAIDRDEQGRWYAVKGAERGYDPLVCDAVADRDDTDHAPTPRGSR